MTVPLGTSIGRYKVSAVLGAGGMGEVYHAYDPGLGREVAIKVLPASLATDADRLRRFEQEARAAGGLTHPNIIAVFDFGSHEGSPYVVTELLEGQTLRARMAGTAMSPRKAVEYGIQIAHGLAAAHHAGIVHRDLKPENVFLTRDGRIKILDFGLAKLVQTDPGASPQTAPTLSVDTGPGTIWGTAGYMSPEQVRGRTVDNRSDIFSFGAILYEMVTGRRAFRGESSADTMSAILKEDPPEITAGSHTVPPGLERIIRHCIEKNPEERFQSARDLAFDLESLTGLSGSSAAALHAPVKGRKARLVPALAGVGVLAALAGSFYIGAKVGNPDLDVMPEYHQVTFGPGIITRARFTPDGNTIVYSAAMPGKDPQVYTARLDSPESRPLGIGYASLQSVSSRSDLLVELVSGTADRTPPGTVARVPLAGGQPRSIVQRVHEIEWAPDGERFAITRLDSGLMRLEFPPGRTLYASSGNISGMRFSPRGDRIAFVDHPQRFDTGGRITVVDLDGVKRDLGPMWRDVDGLAWTPDGKEIWYSAAEQGTQKRVHAVTLDGRSRVLAQAPGALVVQDISKSGRVLLTVRTQRLRARTGHAGSADETELTWFDWTRVTDISDDGKTVLFDESGQGGGPRYAAYLRGTDGSPAVRLGDGTAWDISDDGRWILTASNAIPSQLSLLPVGAGEPRALTADSINHMAGMLLPGGKGFVFFGHPPGEPPQLYVQRLGERRPRVLAPAAELANVRGAAVSPDGKQVAYAASAGRVIVRRLEGDGMREVAVSDSTTAFWPIQWSADGRSVYAVSGNDDRFPVKIDRIELRTGRRSLWTTLESPDKTGVAGHATIVITPDGATYAYSFHQGASDLFVMDGL